MGKNVRYSIRHSSRARRLLIQVTPGVVIVVVPDGVSSSTVDEFLYRKRGWIEKKLNSFPPAGQNTIPPYDKNCRELPVLGENISLGDRFQNLKQNDIRPAIVNWLDGLLMAFLEDKLEKYSHKGLVPASVRLGNARTRWGSCNSRGAIMINRRLVHAPRSVVEYVLVHELVHLRLRNHSKRFWSTVEYFLGDAKLQKKWLRQEGAYLIGSSDTRADSSLPELYISLWSFYEEGEK